VVVSGNNLTERAGKVAGYGLFADGGRVASFAEERADYREWARRRGYIHCLDDCYDHDIDELLA
jgi:hypothetical protein